MTKMIAEQLTNIDKRLDVVSETLIRQEATLAEHVRRTNLLEQKLEPVEKHVAQVNGALKLIGLGSVLCGILVAILQMLGKI